MNFSNVITSKLLKSVALVMLLLAIIFVAAPKTYAVTQEQCDLQKNETLLGLPKWYKYIESVPDETDRCSLQLSGSNTEEKSNSALPIGIALLEGMLRLAGLVAVIMVFWGGFKYITSQGNPDSAKGAKSTVINAMIGLVIVILSSAVVGFIGRSISS